MFLRAAIPFLANNKDLSEYFIMKMDILYGEYLVNVKIVHSQIMQIVWFAVGDDKFVAIKKIVDFSQCSRDSKLTVVN